MRTLTRLLPLAVCTLLTGCQGCGGDGPPVMPPEPADASVSTAMLVGAMDLGEAQLGQWTRVPVDPAQPTEQLHAFTGTPWLDVSGVGFAASLSPLAHNPVDGRFYVVLSGTGAHDTGVLAAFDPTTNTLSMLKTLSPTRRPSVVVNGVTVPFEQPNDYLLRPVVSADGKSLLLRAMRGGVLDRGVLTHVNLDPSSPRYLADTIVFDFFSHEASADGGTCVALLTRTSTMTQLVLQDGKVFMGLGGFSWDPGVNSRDPSLNNTQCTFSSTPVPTSRIPATVFALEPSDPADWSKPWAYSAASSFTLEPRFEFDPFPYKMGRLMHWDGAALRWSAYTDSSVDGLRFYKDRWSNSNLLGQQAGGCNHPLGMVGLNGNLVLCGGLTSGPGQTPPLIARYVETSGGSLQTENTFSDWSARKTFFGAAAATGSGRLFVNGGDFAALTDICAENPRFPCAATSTLEEVQPSNQFARTPLVTGDVNSTGAFFFGDPTVGGAATDAISDRYIVWFGGQVKGHSNVLNKLDRLSGDVSTVRLDPKEGAFPVGKPLSLGGGVYLALIKRAPPVALPAREVADGGAGLGGYNGGVGNWPSTPGFAWFDAKLRKLDRVLSPNVINTTAWNLEPLALADGSLWTAYSRNASRVISKLNVTSGALEVVATFAEDPAGSAAEPFVIASRANVLYAPIASATTPSIGCARAEATSGLQATLPAGTSRVVWGPTFSPAARALYLPVLSAAGGSIVEIDKDVTDASLCTAAPSVTTSVTGLTDLPSTRLLALKSGALVYGTRNGKLMRFDPEARTVTMLADLKGAGPSSAIEGYLAEVVEGTVTAIVFDLDAQGSSTGRRLVQVEVATGASTSRDVTGLVSAFEPYPGVVGVD